MKTISKFVGLSVLLTYARCSVLISLWHHNSLLTSLWHRNSFGRRNIKLKMSAIRLVNPKAEVARAAQALAINISASKGLQDVLRSNLGPKGTMKMWVELRTACRTCADRAHVRKSAWSLLAACILRGVRAAACRVRMRTCSSSISQINAKFCKFL